MNEVEEIHRLVITDQCQHLCRQGDNYGVSCRDCGAALRGYGYWGEGRANCLHSWITTGEEVEPVMCIYCQAVRTGESGLWQRGGSGLPEESSGSTA